MPLTPSRSIRLPLALAAVAATLALSACLPEPAPAPSDPASASASAAPTTEPPIAPTPTGTPIPTGELTLPAGCDAVYSEGMRATLEAENPPLNDPGVTMFSTENAAGLEVLATGVPALRCTWGVPSERGLATTIAVVDPAQASSVRDALAASGFECAPAADGEICRFQQQLLTQDDVVVDKGETHYFRGNGWVATAWLNFAPDGYTEDVVATLWG